MRLVPCLGVGRGIGFRRVVYNNVCVGGVMCKSMECCSVQELSRLYSVVMLAFEV